jgi:predicted NAD/FAD-dependent oxidoreductase
MHFNPITSHELGANVDPIDLVNKGKSWLRNFLGETIEVTHHHSHFWRYAELANGDHQTGALIDHKSSLACIGSWTAGGGVEGAFLSSEHLIGEMC